MAALLLPAGPREAVIAIRAFNVSVAQVQDQVSQGMIGQMRMKFWSDTLDSVYLNTPPAQLVAVQLHKSLKHHKLSKRWFQRLVSSREDQLNTKSYKSLADLEQYSENSVSPVLYLTLECLSIKSLDADHAASHIGRAQGLVTFLRAIPYNSRKQQVYVPTDLLIQHKVSQNDFLRGAVHSKVKDLIFDVAANANTHIEKVQLFISTTISAARIFTNRQLIQQARTILPKLPADAKLGLMPLVSVVSYMDQLRRADFNVFDPKLQQRNNLLPMKLWWHKFRGKI